MINNIDEVNEILDILGIDQKSVSIYTKMDLDRVVDKIKDNECAKAYNAGYVDASEDLEYPHDYYD